MTRYPHGIVVASWQGSLMVAEDNFQFIWWAHKKGKVVDGGRINGLITVTGFTNSPKLSWMNNLIMAVESVYDPSSQKFNGIASEWK